ncbi:unnamed protein product [Urochloa humidicola]
MTPELVLQTTLAHNNTLGVEESVANPIEAERNQDDINEFINFISRTPPAPILHTPPRVNPIPQSENFAEPTTTQRKSTRLADKAKLHPGKDSIQLAQQVLISKLGELSPEPKEQADTNTDFNKLAQHLPQPLTAGTMNAIQTLVEHGNQPRNKKRSKKIAPALAEAQLAQVA